MKNIKVRRLPDQQEPGDPAQPQPGLRYSGWKLAQAFLLP